MVGLSVRTPVEARLDWSYGSPEPRVRALYERATTAQWHAGTDVDWSIDVPYGAPLPDDSPYALAAFAESPLRPGGRALWDAFRWETQAWLVSQFLHGEQAAMVVAARLVETVPELDAKFYAASQAIDEARHVEAFSRYLADHVPEPYPVSGPLDALLSDILSDARWDVTALGMQIMVEALAMAAFRLADSTFHDDLVKQIARLVARDEARHITFGVLSLQGVYPHLTTAELRDREDVVLEAANLIRRRFLLADVWQRLGVDVPAGVEFARRDPLMTAYRQTIFSRIAVALEQVGLMTPRVREGLAGLDLLGAAASVRGRTGG